MMLSPILVPTLAELSDELERAIAALTDAEAALDAREAATGVAVPKGDAMDNAYNEACSACSDLVCEIANQPAQNANDLRVKARALEWHVFPDGQEPSIFDERLAFQIVRALLDGLPGHAK